MKMLHPLALATLALGIAPLAANADDSALIEKVRAATAPYLNINAAIKAGWFIRATPCVSGPDTGAMGVHLMNPAYLDQSIALLPGDPNNSLDPTKPQILIYEPQANGAFRLVGVEYAIDVSFWKSLGHDPTLTATDVPAVGSTYSTSLNGTVSPTGATAIKGQLMNYQPAPNRFGLSESYYLHIWAWQDNPKGSFADWNTNVTCTHQPD